MTSQMTSQRSSLGFADPLLVRSSSYVDGQWITRDGGERIVVHNPSTGAAGLGREGSVYGIDEYMEMKYLAWEGAGAS